MSFTDLEIRQEYRSPQNNVVRDFYLPVLGEAFSYKRSVGFFSSSALIQISKGICRLAKKGGTIELVASPHLSEEDLSAIEKGYENRAKIIENALLRSLKEKHSELFADERLNFLANLIEQGILNIKIAFTENTGTVGMYHEKLGLVEDADGNKIAFSGSMNESANAMYLNYEAIDVFCSWKGEDSKSRVIQKEEAFSRIWGNYDEKLSVKAFPSVDKAILQKYKRKNISDGDYKIDELELKSPVYRISHTNLRGNQPLAVASLKTNVPTIPFDVTLYDYQEEAIEKWAEQDYRGIFDMATGTGKTLTGLAALVKLYEQKHDEKLFAIIVCPYQHLVEQWVEDIEKFNIQPIIGFSSSPQKDWKTNLRYAVNDISLKALKKDFFCFICTNATFSSDFVQNQISHIRVPKLLIVDEAHNFGAPYLSKWLLDSYDWRIGLSATINRHGDEEGTEKLFGFFGEKVIEYDIERAIKEKKLTPYKYYPVLVFLDDDELDEYKRLSKEIRNNQTVDKKGKHKLSEYGKILAMQRARIIAGAKAKIPALREKIAPYKNDTHLLVYCGATTNLTENEDSSAVEEAEERQIVTISKMLGNELGIKNHHFTSNENVRERNELKERFTDGDLQALVAIKCLDEGVNIPKIKTAFILASTTNPKEYIQRRGRVLRLSDGKDFAEIFDFLTLPYPLESVPSLTEVQVGEVKSLVKRELLRAEEFARISLNWGEAESVLNEIRLAYNLRENSDTENETETEVFDE